tara:strand:+ start:299 stop:826 length:528 start_codon:yes stop_codon:yes gene_type:complete
MLNLKLTDEVRNYANRQVSIKNFGVRSAGFNGNRIRQYTGIVGECMVHLAMGEDMPRYDSGSLIEDLKINGKKVDVKTMARNVDMRDFYVHNFVGYQKDRKNDVLLFNSINKKTGNVQICGWLPKKIFLERASFFDKGSERKRTDGTSFITQAPLYEIENSKLIPINTVTELKNI